MSAQTRPPEARVGVDTGSQDDSLRLLRDGLGEQAVVLEAPGASFGAAARRAVDAAGKAPAGSQAWFWFLHDDAAPAPDALEALLEAIEKAPSVTVAGCKQLDAERPDRLLDAGLTMTRRGERFNPVAPGEVDQGQYDQLSDVLGVNSAGLLIRADVFHALGGFDLALPGVGDDVDLGRTARLSGHRVVLVPEARIYHQPDQVESVSGPRAVARAAAYSRLKFAPAWALPFLSVWMFVAGIGRAVGRLIAKDPRGAIVELGAGGTGFARAGALATGRRKLKAAQSVPRAVVKPLLATPSTVRDRRRAQRENDKLRASDAGASHAPAREASGGDDGFDAVETGPRAAGTTGGLLIGLVISAGLSLLGLHHFFGAQAASRGSLLAPGKDLSGLWEAATSGWRELGTGGAGAPDPLNLFTWLGGVLSFGHQQQLAVALYVLAMPLAALFAWLLLGALTRSSGFRFLGALIWALAPSLQLSLAQGRPGSIITHVVLPLLVLALIRAVGAARGEADGSAPAPGRGGIPSWVAVCCAALLATLVSAAEPLLFLPLTLLCIVAGCVSRRSRGLLWVPVPALLLLLPLLLAALRDPRVLLVQPGLPLEATAAPLWQQMLGWPVGFRSFGTLPFLENLGSVPLGLIAAAIMAVPLGIMAVLALVRPGPGTTTARVLTLAGLLVLLLGWAASHLEATVSGSTVIHPYAGSFVSAFALAVLIAAAVQRETLLSSVRARTKVSGGARALTGVFSTLVALSVLVAAVLWSLPRVNAEAAKATAFATEQLVQPDDGEPLPATAADRGLGRYAERTLVLTPQDDGSLGASLVSGDGLRSEDLSSVLAAQLLKGNPWVPGSATRAPERPGDEAVRGVVAILASGEQLDARADLARLAVSHVVLTANGAGADVLAKTLDAVPGLSAVGRSDEANAWIWRVRPAEGNDNVEAQAGSPTARVRIVDAKGVAQALVRSTGAEVSGQTIASGPAGRKLVLAQSADAGWTATLNGKKLQATTDEWAQAFELPENGGTLEVKYSSPLTPWWLAALMLSLLICLLSVVPVPRSWRADARQTVSYRPSVAQRGSKTQEARPTSVEPAAASAPEKKPDAAATTGQATAPAQVSDGATGATVVPETAPAPAGNQAVAAAPETEAPFPEAGNTPSNDDEPAPGRQEDTA